MRFDPVEVAVSKVYEELVRQFEEDVQDADRLLYKWEAMDTGNFLRVTPLTVAWKMGVKEKILIRAREWVLGAQAEELAKAALAKIG